MVCVCRSVHQPGSSAMTFGSFPLPDIPPPPLTGRQFWTVRDRGFVSWCKSPLEECHYKGLARACLPALDRGFAVGLAVVAATEAAIFLFVRGVMSTVTVRRGQPRLVCWCAGEGI